jgi:hypothetical protein|tara:strand:+ start:3576 stop:4520 length:945 start_codon:yes stop_codon:yes gene_type:complete
LDFSIDDAPDAVRLTRIQGPVRGAISSDTVLHGDFDTDGFADLAIGNPHDNPIVKGLTRTSAGSVSILYGRAGGWPDAIDLLPANLPPSDELRLAQLAGALGTVGGNTGDTLCYSAASGDIDGDGVPDLIVNEMVGDGLGGLPADVGNLIIVRGIDFLPPESTAFEASSEGMVDFGTLSQDGVTKVLTISFRNTSQTVQSTSALAITGSSAFSIESTSGTGNFDPGEVFLFDLAEAQPILESLLREGATSFVFSSQKDQYYTLTETTDFVTWETVSRVEGTGESIYYTPEDVSASPAYYQLEGDLGPFSPLVGE